MNINKNIAVWRGNSAPPTQYHLWLKGDALLHYNGTEWVLNNFPLSTPDEDGLMSKEDKAKLDNLVYDGVDSDRGDIALSARQGRILSEKITDLNTYVYKPKGSVQEIQDLPLDNLRIGDVYNVVNPFYIQDLKYPGGTNVVWTGEQWDPLGGTVDFSDYYTKEEVNDINTDITDAINNEISRATEAELELKAAIDSKVDKIEGKGLSTNDYTTEDKDKLDNLVCDSLESDRGDLALSAKLGKILLGKITDLNLSGTSLLRPTNPSNGLPFFDKTLRRTIWYNDGVWIDSNGDNADIPRRGETSERPNPSDVSIGFQYYDTTLERLLTSNGTDWVENPDPNLYWVLIDETGNIVDGE